MKPSEALRTNRGAVLAAALRFHVSNIRVFGSAARGDDGPESDIDLLVEVPRGTTLLDMVALEDELQRSLGVPVDVVTIEDLPERIRSRVLAEARPL
jgi:uncharacterized protein